MDTLTLSDIKNRVAENSTKNKKTTVQIMTQIKNKDLKQGRVRPKNATEAKILARFSRS